MKRSTFFVVGDQYDRFAKNQNIFTLSDLQRRLAADASSVAPARVVIGQGVRHEDAAALERSTKDSKMTVGPASRPAPLSITHKREVRNVLISEPRKIGPMTYEMELVLDDLMDRLADHVTGQHIGGMLQIEAARQAGIAVVELALLAEMPERYGFMWSGLEVEFLRFAFPLPMHMEVKIEERTAGEPPKTTRVALVELTQGGQPITRLTMHFELIKQATLERIESKAAVRAIEAARVESEAEDAAEENVELAV